MADYFLLRTFYNYRVKTFSAVFAINYPVHNRCKKFIKLQFQENIEKRDPQEFNKSAADKDRFNGKSGITEHFYKIVDFIMPVTYQPVCRVKDCG